MGLAVAPKSRRLFASGRGGDLVQYVLGDKRPVSRRQVRLPGNGLTLALSPDETLLAVGQPGACTLHRADSLSLIRGLPTVNAVWAAAFSPDGRFLAYGGGSFEKRGEHEAAAQVNTDVYVYDLREERVVLHERLHRGVVNALAWHPTRVLLASGGLGEEVHLWDPEAGEGHAYRGTLRTAHFGPN